MQLKLNANHNVEEAERSFKEKLEPMFKDIKALQERLNIKIMN